MKILKDFGYFTYAYIFNIRLILWITMNPMALIMSKWKRKCELPSERAKSKSEMLTLNGKIYNVELMWL